MSNQEIASVQPNLKTYFCLCGNFCLVIDKSLDELPVRKTDSSYILPKEEVHYKTALSKGEKKYLKRGEGLELQFQYFCTHCNLMIAYHCQNNLKEKDHADYFYVLKDALATPH